MINRPQQHPQYHKDLAVIESLNEADMSDYNLAELGRLMVRYQDFPGAYDLKEKLNALLGQWDLTKEELFVRTREIHKHRPVYKTRSKKVEKEDWN